MPVEYPLSEHHAEDLRTPSGIPFTELTLDAVLDGRIGIDDLRVTAEALEWQAQIADRAGRPQLAANLRRAAELVAIPESEILEIYELLRPGRGTREQLESRAADLESRYAAHRCATLLREAASACEG